MIEDDIEDIGIINENNVFVPPPNIGSFKTINRVSFSKNIEESNTNTNNLEDGETKSTTRNADNVVVDTRGDEIVLRGDGRDIVCGCRGLGACVKVPAIH